MNRTPRLTLGIPRLASWLALLLVLPGLSWAQTTANWTGGAGDGDWNNGLNWDQGAPPAEGTNAILGTGVLVNYNAPMSATRFAGVSSDGTLNINARGLNIDALGTLAAYTGNANSFLQVNAGGAVVATNSSTVTLTTGSSVVVQGGVLTITNSTGNVALGVNGNNNGAGFTNNSGTVVFSQPLQSKGRYTRFEMHGGSLSLLGGGGIFESSNDQERKFLIDGGTAFLGDFSIGRTLNSVGAAGLVISNGNVSATSLRVGTGIAASGATVYGGTLTNTGVFAISDRNNAATSGGRQVKFYVRGGTVVSTAPDGIVVANQANNSNTGGNSVWGAYLDINSGLILAEKLTLVGPNALTNAYANLLLSGSGAIYLGPGGLVGNVGYSNTSYTISLGGTLGAYADYSIVGNGTLSGTLTVDAEDLGHNSHNITHTGTWSGSGALLKTGGGVLSLQARNTYSGATTVSAGTLALGATGSISNSPILSVTSGAVLDLSAQGAPVLLGSQSLEGSGSVVGALTALSGSAVRPGGTLSAGTLTFAGGLTEAGGVNNALELSTDPTGTITPNDLLNIVGDLNLSGTNAIQITTFNGPLPSNSTYKLIQYTGSFNGGLTNLSVSGAGGVLSNDVSGKAIYLTIQSAQRPPTNVVWLGNPAANNWDTLVTSNWLNGASRDVFVTGDNARFDDAGAANPVVTVAGSVSPGSVVVDTALNYALTGTGTLDGAGGLTKTNAGTLSILTVNNSYAGGNTIGGGTVEAAKLSNGGIACSLGTASSDPANLQFFNGALRYLGTSVSIDRGATFNQSGGTVDVASNATSLTLIGSLVGTGGLAKAGPGTLILAGSGSYAGVTSLSNGILQVNSSVSALGTNAINFAGGTLSLNVSGQPTYPNALNVLSTGGITSAGGGNNLLTGPWSGSGTLSLSIASGYFTINGDMTANFTGTILVTDNSAGIFRFNGGGSDPCTGSASATFNLGNSSVTLVNRNGATYGTTVYYLGALAGGPNTLLQGSKNTGSPNTYEVGDNNASTTFAGVIANGAGGSSAVVSILKAGTGTWTLSGTNTYGGATTISNGVLALSGYGALRNSATIEVMAGTTLDASSRADGTLTLNSGQSLLGEGTVHGSVMVRSNATVSPGPAGGNLGKLTVNGALTLQPGSTVTLDADFNTATNDVIDGLTSVTYGGTLNLNLTSVDLSSSFKLFNAGAYGGVFDAILPPSPASGWVWDTSRLAVDGTLKVKTFVATQPQLVASVSGANLALSGTGGPAGLNFSVYATSDLSLPLNSWANVGSGNFRSDGSFTFIVPVDPNVPQQFYSVQYYAP